MILMKIFKSNADAWLGHKNKSNEGNKLHLYDLYIFNSWLFSFTPSFISIVSK